jgi:hypothetical protein
MEAYGRVDSVSCLWTGTFRARPCPRGNSTVTLMNKINRCTEFQFYWYYESTRFGQSISPSSGVLSRTSALGQFMQFGDRVLPGARWNWNSWWWAERLPETCRVIIPIKLELSASVGFIRKESITMYSHTVLKHRYPFLVGVMWASSLGLETLKKGKISWPLIEGWF